MGNWKNILISPATSIYDAIQIIDREGLRAALVVNENKKLLGIVTDGDIRRCILKNISLADTVQTIMNCHPITASINDTREKLFAKLKQLQLYHLPLIDEEQRVMDFATLEQLTSSPKRANPVIIMAGGLGKRLYPLTLDCPKPLIKVGDKPVLEILLENFIKFGFQHFWLAVNYKSEMIKEYFGSGDKWEVNINYLEEETPLGTAGALGLMPALPDKSFFVINADVMTTIDFEALMRYHEESQVDATMCIRQYEQMIPYGVVQREQNTHLLLNIVEKPVKEFFVNAGIYILEPHVLHLAKAKNYLDMPDLLLACVQQGLRVTTFPIKEYWLDIGKHEDLNKAHVDYEKIF